MISRRCLSRADSKFAGSQRVIVLCPAFRFSDHLVDEIELLQVARAHLQGFRRRLALADVLPEDCRGGFGADHRIPRILKHEHPVRYPDA